MSDELKTWPERIWLQHGEDCDRLNQLRERLYAAPMPKTGQQASREGRKS